MNKNKKIIIGSVVFILCFAVGFFVSHILTEGKDNVPAAKVSGDVETISKQRPFHEGGSSTPLPRTFRENPSRATDLQPEPEIIVVNLRQTGSTYSLKVKCENVPTDMTINYKILGIDIVSENGEFKRIPGISSGKYTITAFNVADQQTIARKEVNGFAITEEPQQQVSKMTASEFQSLLLNQNDNTLLGGRNPKVSRYVALKCTGLREDDFPANDILHVREKIANGIWKSASVTSIGYNEQGLINSATISPIY